MGCSQWTPFLGTGVIQPFKRVPPPPPPSGGDLAEKPGVIPVITIPLLSLEGVPGLSGAPQDEAGLRRKFETSHV